MDILESQKDIIEFLNNSKKQERLAHAYLFEGPKGVGKLETALYFICMLWCKDDKPCLKCNTCKSILNKQFLNLVYISSDTSLIKTNEINELQKEFASTATLDGPRFYIIEDADKMSVDTQNKLLKFIEEPVSYQTYGILLTTNPDYIISTIKSRVITLKFKELSYEYLVSKLEESNVDTKYRYLLPYIENNVDKCLNLLNNSIQVKVIDKVYDFINNLSNNDIDFFFRNNQELLSERSNIVLFINLLQEFYKDLFKVMINQNPLSYPNVDYTKLKKRYKMNYLSEIIAQLVDLEYKLRYNSNINLNIVKLLIVLSGGE